MEYNRQHLSISPQIERDFGDKVREFIVIDDVGEGVLMVAEEDGNGYWLVDVKRAARLTRPGVRMEHGKDHMLLLNENGQLYALGMNDRGQLGQGIVEETINYTPLLIVSPHRFSEVCCGAWHSLALTEAGKVWAWGDNDYGQVGLPRPISTSSPSPRQIQELDSHRVVAIECGGYHSLALTGQGHVYGWGYNGWGQLAQTDLSPQPIPVRLPSSSAVTQLAAGECHTLLLTVDGEVFACGKNYVGRPITSLNQANPTLCQVPGLPRISKIAAHFDSDLSIALSADLLCFVWGKGNQFRYLIPLQLPPIYSTIASPMAFWATRQNTPHSGLIEFTQSSPDSLQDRVSRMFDNPDSEPDLQFVLGENSILAHRAVLQLSTANFTGLVPDPYRCQCLDFSSSETSFSQTTLPLPLTYPSEPDYSPTTSGSIRHATYPSEPDFSPTTSGSIRHDTHQSEPDFSPTTSGSIRHVTHPSEPDFSPTTSGSIRHVTHPSEPDFSPTTSGSIRHATHQSEPDFSPTTSGSIRHVTHPSEPDFSPTTSGSIRHATSPSEPDTTPSLHSPYITRIPIFDYSYPVFHTFLRYIYTGLFQVPVDLLPGLFELSLSFQCLDLQQLCLGRMISTVSLSTWCTYYQLAERHQLSTLLTQVVKFTADNLVEVFRTEAFRSMDPELSRRLTLAASDLDPRTRR